MSLYQQEPQAEEGDFFQRGWIRWYPWGRSPENVRVYGASDYAVTSAGGDYTVHLVVGVNEHDDIYVLDLWREQASSDVWVESFLDLVERWKPLQWGEEAGQIQKGIGPFLNQRVRERGVYTYRVQFASASDKPTRAQAIRGRLSMGKVWFPEGAPWVDDLVGELTKFPAGTNDDQVDTLSLIGRMLNEMVGAPAPQEPEPEEDCYLRAKRRMITAGWGRLRCSLGRHPDPTCKGRGGVLDSGISRVGSGRLQTVRVLSCAQVDQSRRPQQQLTRPLAAQRRALRPNPLARVRKRRKR